MVWKFLESYSFRKFCLSCTFPQNLHIRKLGKILVFYAVEKSTNFGRSNLGRSKRLHNWFLCELLLLYFDLFYMFTGYNLNVSRSNLRIFRIYKCEIWSCKIFIIAISKYFFRLRPSKLYCLFSIKTRKEIESWPWKENLVLQNLYCSNFQIFFSDLDLKR